MMPPILRRAPLRSPPARTGRAARSRQRAPERCGGEQMRKHPSFVLMAVLSVVVLALAACTGGASPTAPAETGPAGTEPAATGTAEATATEAPTGLAACGDPDSGEEWLIGGVTDVGQLEDKSFNEGGWCGTIAGATSVGGTAGVIVTGGPGRHP